MIEQCDLAERRACRIVGLCRDSYRHPPEVDTMTQELSGKIIEIAYAHRRFGYRRIDDLLRPQFPGVNHKKVRRAASERVPLHLAQSINEVWSMDFVCDSLSTGRRYSSV